MWLIFLYFFRLITCTKKEVNRSQHTIPLNDIKECLYSGGKVEKPILNGRDLWASCSNALITDSDCDCMGSETHG